MNVLEIPFVEHVGIVYAADGELLLPSSAYMHNHVGTMHAAALFALAETQSGLCLQALFAGDSPPAVLPYSRLPILSVSTAYWIGQPAVRQWWRTEKYPVPQRRAQES